MASGPSPTDSTNPSFSPLFYSNPCQDITNSGICFSVALLLDKQMTISKGSFKFCASCISAHWWGNITFWTWFCALWVDKRKRKTEPVHSLSEKSCLYPVYKGDWETRRQFVVTFQSVLIYALKEKRECATVQFATSARNLDCFPVQSGGEGRLGISQQAEMS